MSDMDWAAANHGVLLAEFARIRAQLEGAGRDDAQRSLEAARVALPSPAAIDLVTEAFVLSAFERDMLLLCAGVELDHSLAQLCAQLHGLDHTHPTFGLALAHLAEPHWSALTPVRPLRRWQLVKLHEELQLTTSALTVDERILHFIRGVNYLDPRLESSVQPVRREFALSGSHRQVVDAVISALAAKKPDAAVVQLVGDDPLAQRGVACEISAMLGLHLHRIPASGLTVPPGEVRELASRWYRESLLLRSALLLDAGDDASSAFGFADQVGGLVFVVSRHPLASRPGDLGFQVDRPLAHEQKEMWVAALGDAAHSLNGSLDALATHFRLATGDMVGAAARVADESTDHAQLSTALWDACRTAKRRHLNGLAQRVECRAGWDDLVLPEPQVAALRQICAHVRNRYEVHERWGFAGKSSRGLGVSVLFSGESGTGKTMAAEVLARELDLDLFRVDLASLVSKYIGETEKNLREVFDAAEDTGAILLFDEADALFGPRSEVKSSHDRFANIEVSYLLQRMEAYRGLAILTTNLKNCIDPAFQRRLRFIVQFPFPDELHRERIWRGIFPTATPMAEVNFRRLAQLSIAGGHIRNIALGAAFLAADAGGPVGMSHLLQAARTESSKRERPFSDAELRGWQ